MFTSDALAESLRRLSFGLFLEEGFDGFRGLLGLGSFPSIRFGFGADGAKPKGSLGIIFCLFWFLEQGLYL